MVRVRSVLGLVSVVGALCTLGMVPSRPFWKSSNACITSALVFITNGPAHATGSRIGRPPSTSTSRAGVRLSWLPDGAAR